MLRLHPVARPQVRRARPAARPPVAGALHRRHRLEEDPGEPSRVAAKRGLQGGRYRPGARADRAGSRWPAARRDRARDPGRNDGGTIWRRRGPARASPGLARTLSSIVAGRHRRLVGRLFLSLGDRQLRYRTEPDDAALPGPRRMGCPRRPALAVGVEDRDLHAAMPEVLQGERIGAPRIDALSAEPGILGAYQVAQVDPHLHARVDEIESTAGVGLCGFGGRRGAWRARLSGGW